jgi:transposase
VRVERIGKEACEERISWAGIARVGHEVRLIRAHYVKLYVKTNKSDYMDAETIAEAAGRPTVTIFTQALESV